MYYFKKKNHLHLFALEVKKIDAELGKNSIMVPKNTSHLKKKEVASAMSKSDSLAMNKKNFIVKKRDAATKKKKYAVKKERDAAKKSEVMAKTMKLDGGVHNDSRVEKKRKWVPAEREKNRRKIVWLILKER